MTAPLTWVVGAGGLLGGHLSKAVPERGPVLDAPRVPWSDPRAARTVLQATAERLLATAGPAGWQVLWSAGAGVTGTTQEDLDDELAALGAALTGLAGAAPRGGAGSFFLASSVGGVYAGVGAPPYDELSPVRPLAAYGHAKLAAEAAVTRWAGATGNQALIGRLANLYGPGQNLAKPQGLISQICAAHLNRRPVPIWVSLDTLRDYLFAPDAPGLVLDAMDRLRTQPSDAPLVVTKVLASQRALTVGAVLGELRRVLRGRPTIILAASPASSLQARDLSVRSVVWPDLDRRILTTFPAGVAMTVQDLRHTQMVGAAAG